MTTAVDHAPTRRISYRINDLISPGHGPGVPGFSALPWQPYPRSAGIRLSAPALEACDLEGFTEVVHVADGVSAVIIDWDIPPQASPMPVWAECVDSHVGYLYIGVEGDGRIEIEGLGTARRRGPSCSLTVTPPGSTYVWQPPQSTRRRGVAIAVHGRYLSQRYPALLGACHHSLGPWLSLKETMLRDFDIPLLPVMSSATASLLNLQLEGDFRHHFVCATVEQLLCLSISALISTSRQKSELNRLSVRDRAALREIRSIVDGNIAATPRPEHLARKFGINRNKLRFGFKEMFGVTISAYINEQRMRKAHELLTAGAQSVSDVACAVGYTHLCNFTTAFRRRFGVPPSRVFNSDDRYDRVNERDT